MSFFRRIAFAARRTDFGTMTRYVVVMGLGSLTDLAMFVAVVRWLPIPAAQLMARLAGAVVGFLLHRHFTFQRARRRPTLSAMTRYGAVWLFGYFLSTWLILTLAASGRDVEFAKVMVEIALVPVIFLLLRFFVFTHRD